MEFYDDRLLIKDHGPRDHFVQDLLVVSQIILGLSFLWRGIREHDAMWIFTGIVLLALWLILLIISVVTGRPTGKKEILLSEIREVARDKGGYTWEQFRIKLNNKRVRIVRIDKSKDLPAMFQQQLQSYHIPVVE